MTFLTENWIGYSCQECFLICLGCPGGHGTLASFCEILYHDDPGCWSAVNNLVQHLNSWIFREVVNYRVQHDEDEAFAHAFLAPPAPPLQASTNNENTESEKEHFALPHAAAPSRTAKPRSPNGTIIAANDNPEEAVSALTPSRIPVVSSMAWKRRPMWRRRRDHHLLISKSMLK